MKALTIITAIALAWGTLASIAMPDKQECDVVIPEFCNAVQGPDLAPLPAGWEIVAAADFNNDHYPDLFLYNKTTGQTYIWFLTASRH